tara:strand:- start:20 stop:256 length:237 start_codon:yes stop_codon:yes gene_type:complete
MSETLILPKATVDIHGWHCIKCWKEDALDSINNNLMRKETDHSELVEYWVCLKCGTDYQVDVEIERDFLTMTEINKKS